MTDDPNSGEEAFARAPAITGPIFIEGLVDIDPIWRPLVTALAATVAITWTVPDDTDRSWFPGSVAERVSAGTPGGVCPSLRRPTRRGG
jgi:hypothetical protein